MLLCSTAVLAAAVAQLSAIPGSVPTSLPPSTGIAIPAATRVHLGISLRFPAPAAVQALLASQQDPSSPAYRRWLTAAEFGERFGQPQTVYEQAARWLEAGGFAVTPSPNRLYIEGQGLASQVQSLLGLQLMGVSGRPVSVHMPDALPTLPSFLKGVVIGISGLDTRTHYRHRLLASDGGKPSFGPQDLRRFYDSQALLDQGYVGQNQKLVVLSEAETIQDAPSQTAIEYYLRNISDSSAVFSEAVLPNPQQDFDQEGGGGGGTEFALDSEMQSVGAPGAESITLVVPPASEVFTTGANYIVNQLESATAVSVSLGLCELGVEQTEDGVVTSMQQFLEQGLAEGQTWSAATGDNGADDCRDGQDVAVDFPASIPQMVAVGGTELTPSWDSDNALTAYQQETAWNAGNGGGAGGGGFSVLYPLPSYQRGAPFMSDGGRSLPDVSLIAGSPGVLIDDPTPGPLEMIQGTSVASPLSAGFFALVASRVGCRLGDVHATLYMLGNAQLDGGAQVFHDILTGSATYDGVNGPRAGVGYDSVTGWGSLDVEALAEAWPPCPGDAGPGPVAAFDPCEVLGCSGDSTCETLTEGPSSCVAGCAGSSAASCGVSSVCSSQTLFFADAGTDAGVCVPGCTSDLDCGDAGACDTCEQLCEPIGQSSAKIGDPCVQSSDCPSGGICIGATDEDGFFANGYCTQLCTAGADASSACECPSGSACNALGRFPPTDLCLQTCPTIGAPCGQTGYVCQPVENGNACLPACMSIMHRQFTLDYCSFEFNSPHACNVDSGVCTVPIPDAGADAGVDGGQVDAGQVVDGGTVQPDAGSNGGPSSSGHSSGCSTTGGGLGAGWGLAGLAILLRRRRTGRRG